MLGKLLSIVIPTRGVPNYLDYVLNYYSNYRISDFVNLYICDASEDSSIKDIVDHYSEHLTIHYIHVDSHIGFDEQTMIALRLPNTKYVHLCGHGVIYRKERLMELLDVLKRTDYDMYVVMGKWCGEEAHSIPNDDNGLLLKYWFASLTMYGGTVLSKALIDKYDDKVISKYYGTYFAYTCCIFEYLDSPYYIFKDTLFEISEEKMRNSSFWSKSRIIEMWSTNYCKSIDLLPNKYNNYKKYAYKLHADNILSRKSIMYYRTNGNYNYIIFRRNKRYLHLASGCNIFELLLISLTPSFLFRTLYYLKHRKKPWKK